MRSLTTSALTAAALILMPDVDYDTVTVGLKMNF